MRQIFFSLTLLLAVAILSGYKPDGKKEPVKKTATEKTVATKPKILLMLNNGTGKSAWSPSLWWKYEHAKPSQIGC